MTPKTIDIHTHAARLGENLLQIVNLRLEQPCPNEGLFSYGIHPWEADNADFQMERKLLCLEERLKSPQAVALGEAGLDKMHKDSFERQTILFERQIELSEALGKPMILHDVRSHNEIIALRKRHRARQRWILHGFNGTEQDVRQLTAQGISLSVGESVLHPDRKICKSLKTIPLEFLFLETDTAGIDVEKVYEAVADVLEMDVDALETRIFANFAALWNTGKTEPAY